MIEYIGILILAFFAALLVSVFLLLASTLGPKRPNRRKMNPLNAEKNRLRF